MTTALEKACRDYQKTLSTLDSNNKQKINILTMLAEDYAKHSEGIVNVIKQSILEVPNNQKLFRLYLVDSIVKNLRETGDYVEHFAECLVEIFVHVFQRSDERTRASLFKLRSTWTDIFPRGQLYSLDLEIHQIDVKWPISFSRTVPPITSTPQTNGVTTSNTSTSTTITTSTASTRPAASAVDPSPQTKETTPSKLPSTTNGVLANSGKIYVNPNFKPKANSSSESTDSDAQPTVQTPKPPITISAALQKISAPNQKKTTPAAPAVKKTEFRPPVVDPRRATDPRKPTGVRDEPMDTSEPKVEAPKTKPKEVKNGKLPINGPSKSLVKTFKIPKKTKKPSVPSKAQAGTTAADLGRLLDETVETPNAPKLTPLLTIDNSKTKRKIPRRAPAPAEKRRRTDSQCSTDGVSWTANRPIPHRNSPGPVIHPTAALGSHAFDVPPQPAIQQPALPPAYPPFQPPVINPPSTFPIPRYGTPLPQIRNDAPRLPNAMGNNRIFVDGKAYEVLFINDIAVIERNGVPHRVFFSGHPRDVIVDGVAHRLAFNETKPIEIDGQMHYIRFGAPSRELYMGDFPFRGAFGSGPPIVATINGKRHEIRLGGPPPEVKIEQDPCYELARHLQAARMNVNPPIEPPKRVEEEKDKLGDLLAKLQRTGVLDNLGAALRSSQVTGKKPINREVTPPIIASAAILGGADREAPGSALSSFNPSDLHIWYESVIRSLLEPRSVCPDCGVQIFDRDSVQYKRHVDEHVQREIGNQPVQERGPYLSEDEWIDFSYVDVVNQTATKEPTTEISLDEETKVQGEDAMSSETDLRICEVCREDFREYFDADADEWRLENSVIMNGKPYHRTCQADATFDETVGTESLSIES
ncbi:CID domain-containing protein [Aphelenchoides besseyi]|nr:CID domain-containing protein [Aphelenchoides besseyi]KAI6193237.1 CID domain-containing protein [Aphelenchoides besseyi]